MGLQMAERDTKAACLQDGSPASPKTPASKVHKWWDWDPLKYDEKEAEADLVRLGLLPKDNNK